MKLSQADFAKHIGKTRGYITQLKTAGRLVMSGDLVDVEATLKLIDETKDMSKSGVAQRHEAERQAKMTVNETLPNVDSGEKAGRVYQQSKAQREYYNALAAKRDYELSAGKLLVAENVISIVTGAASVVRIRLESLPDILAPQFAAETDEQKIRAIFHDQIEHLLTELSNQFKNLAKESEK